LNEPIALVLEGVLPPEQQWKYFYLPFAVPENVGRIDVSYSYDSVIGSDPQLSGGNTIDIGIFDSRGIDFHSPGYRGWTGSARSSFFIATDSATPGYMPGPILPGVWQIILGPYKVAEKGCHYRVDITLTPTENTQGEFPALLQLTDIPGKRLHADGWYKGELHCHTFHSDGDSSPEEIVRLAESLDLDFLAVTDHNNRSQSIDLPNLTTDLILLPGYEVTTYYGHWNIWGDQGWIDFRVQSADDLSGFIAEADRRGFLVSCNHPRPYGPDWAFADVEGFRCVEVWNGPWQLMNTACLAFWEAKLRHGQRLTAVGGSDHHFTKRNHTARLGHPTTYIYCPGQPSAVALLDALRAGHAFVTESPTDPQLKLCAGEAMMGDAVPRPANGQLDIQLEVIGGEGSRLQILGADRVLSETAISTSEVTLEWTVKVANTPYIRAQLIDPDNGFVRALTNPIYF
jgi:hypothetical protein